MKKIAYIFTVLILTIFMFNPSAVRADAPECKTYTNQTACGNAKGPNGRNCYWDSKAGFCKESSNSYRNDYNNTEDPDGDIPVFINGENEVSCGNIKGIPDYIPFISSLTITVLTIISMGMLVIMGTIDLFRGINSGKPEDMKKCQKTFFNRVGSAVLLFFLVALTRLLIGFVNINIAGGKGIMDCVSCFINNKCS